MSFWHKIWSGPRSRMGGLVRAVLVIFFLWLAGRFWHPFYGFTKFLQIEASAEMPVLPVLHSAPIYLYHRAGGYDGQYYAQIATSPALQDPALSASIDNLGYRARRILLGWIAWLAGLGDPVAAVRAYAWLNPLVWLVLAALLWRLFPSGDWRATAAWAGLLFAGGTLLSVRFALTDLAALTLLVAALWQLECGRSRQGVGWLGLASLARETSVLGAVVLLPGAGASRGDWWRAAGRGLLTILPLAGWLVYLERTVGRPEAGQLNFSWPVTGLVNKWCEAIVGLTLEADHGLAIGSLLVLLALTVQLLFLVVRPQWHNPWWRLGAVYGALLLCLGPAVWEGLQFAAMRVVLPLSLAFNVLGVRTRAGALWLILGNLAVWPGVLALWVVPDNPHEMTARWSWNSKVIMETDRDWYATESRKDHHWAWCRQDGRLTLRFWPHRELVRLQLNLQGFTARDLEIRHAGTVVWRGRVGNRPQWIQLPELPTENGDLVLTVHSDDPPQKEGTGPYARALGFSCSGFKLD